MNWVERYYEEGFEGMLHKDKVLVVYGARQVGKTSLINRMLKDKENIFTGDGNDLDLQEILGSGRLSKITNAFGGYKYIFIDEAHKINKIGDSIKLLIDHVPGIIVVLSGSSSFQLSGQLGEPLTGRQSTQFLFPLSVLELSKQVGSMKVLSDIESLLIFGSYPEAYTSKNSESKIKYLVNLRNSYLLRDILELENVRNASKLFDLLRLLAFQVGMEVSINELSNQLGIAKQTVEKYIDLLEKVFVIVRVQGFSRNLRKEITKTHRYYFRDNGIRNAIINNFNPLNLRNDRGMLWENFLFAERLKTQEYLSIHSNNFFWRTYDQKEIDMIEERDGRLFAYEFKFQPKRLSPPKLWLQTYPDSEFKVISKENFMDFLCRR